MIFNSEINMHSKEDIALQESLIKLSEFTSGIIFESTLYNSIMLLEKNIIADDVNLPRKSSKASRYIMIGNLDKAKHSPRIKITKNGERPNTINKTISIGYNNGSACVIAGEPKNIEMSNQELKNYLAFAERHYNLIMLSKNNDLMDNIARAIIEDEQRFTNKIDYTRSGDGSLVVFKKNKYDRSGNKIVDYMETLKGVKKYNDSYNNEYHK